MKAKNFTSTFLEKTWIILVVTVAAGLTTFLVLHRREKEYKSTARLAIGLSEQVKKKENEVLFEIDIQNHVEAIKTEFVGTLVSYNLLLHDLHETPFRRNSFLLSPSERSKTIHLLKDKLKTFEPLSPGDPFESKLQTVINQKGYEAGNWVKDDRLRVSRIDNSNLVKVEFLSENPTLSAFIVNNLCSEYVRYTTFWNVGSGVADSLTHLITEKRSLLESKANQLAAYKSKPTRNQDEGELLDRLVDYESQLEAEKKNAARISGSLREIDIKISQQPTSGQVVNSYSGTSPKVTQLQSKISELNSAYVKAGSKDEALAKVIDNLRSQLKLELNRLDQESSKNRNSNNSRELLNERERLAADQQEVDSQIQSLRASINRLRRTISSGGPQDNVIKAMEADYNHSYQELVGIQEEYKKARSENQLTETPPAVKLVTAGIPSAEPESSDLLLTTFAVMLITVLFTAIVILVIAHYRTVNNNTVDSPLMILR